MNATAVATQEQVEVTTVGMSTEASDKEARVKKWREEEKQRQERWEQEGRGPRVQQARQLAASFLRRVEGHDYHGYAIVGIPNGTMRGSRFDIHSEDCEECKDGDGDCDEGFEAWSEDNSHDHVLVLKSVGVGEAEDYSGLAYELHGEGGAFVEDLLGDAETVPTEPAPKIPDDNVLAASDPSLVYTPEFWGRARALIDAPQQCEQCRQYRTKISPSVNVRLVLTGDGTPKLERLHLFCTRCHPDKVQASG